MTIVRFTEMGIFHKRCPLFLLPELPNGLAGKDRGVTRCLSIRIGYLTNKNALLL